jgi:RNA polymerase sigma factor (sigma-70 family)
MASHGDGPEARTYGGNGKLHLSECFRNSALEFMRGGCKDFKPRQVVLLTPFTGTLPAKKCIKRLASGNSILGSEFPPYQSTDMTTSQSSKILEHLRKVVLRHDGAELADGQLLEEYLSRGNEAALAALVRRHAPMVWGVCRRTLRNHHDAEDAFQSSFLVLARKAASVLPRHLVGNWLHGVAHRTALKAATTTAKRRARERLVAQMPEPAVTEPDFWSDLEPVLDRELSRLPEKFRVAIILCDLEGQTIKRAAGRLGVPQGTLAARLARGRVMLAKRLARQGLALSVGSLSAALAQNAASAQAPNAVVFSTLKTITAFAAGQASATGLISVKLAALTEGVLKTILPSKLKVAAVVLLTVFAGGGTLALVPSAEHRETQANVVSEPEKHPVFSDKGELALRSPAVPAEGEGEIVLRFGNGGEIALRFPNR